MSAAPILRIGAALRRGALCLLVLASLGTGANAQEGLPLDAVLDAHRTCAAAGTSGGECSGLLARHCLDRAADLPELVACRERLAKALEARAAELVGMLVRADGPTGRTRAIELQEGAARLAGNLCARLETDARDDTAARGHRARCRLMRAHLTTYHLTRAWVEREQDT